MIVNFKDIKHDFYGNIEHPVLMIKRPDGRVISTISNYYGLKTKFRYNDVSEIEFTVPAYHDGEKNNGFDEVSGTRLVEVEPFGDFVLVNPKEENDGIKKIKVCKAYSLEYQINNKRAEIPKGTYNFYNPVDNADTITTIIQEFIPDWSFGTIDSELIGRWRTFDTVDDNLYSFMMGTLQKTYNCLFLFDTKNKKIHVKSTNSNAVNLPIYLSYENLIKNVEVTELSEEIVTALSAYGSGDNVNISAVNPNGTATIYNLDYYLDKGDLPAEVSDKWKEYKDYLELHQAIYSNLNVLYKQKYNELIVADAELKVLEKEYQANVIAYDQLRTEKTNAVIIRQENDPSTSWNSKEVKAQHVDELWFDTKNSKAYKWDGEAWNELSDNGLEAAAKEKYDKELVKIEAEIEEQKNKIDDQTTHVDLITGDKGAIKKQLDDIAYNCNIKNYFTTSEFVSLSPYLKHDSFADSTFMIPEYSSAVIKSQSNRIDSNSEAKINIYGSELEVSNIAQIFSIDENGNYSATSVDQNTGETVVNSNMAHLFGQTDLDTEIIDATVMQLNEDTKRKTFNMRGGNLNFSFKSFSTENGVRKSTSYEIEGNIVSVDFHYNTEDMNLNGEEYEFKKQGAFMLSAILRNATYNDAVYPSMNLTVQGLIESDVPVVGDKSIDFNITSAIFYTSAATSEYQQQTVLQELYDYAVDTLNKLAKPAYEFSVDSANFIFAKEFEPFKDKLELGCTINLQMDPDEEEPLQPILIELELDYDDEASFNINFSNKFHASDSKFKLADIITEASRSSHSLELQKGDYMAYSNTQTGSQVANITNSALDSALNGITNSENQGCQIDSRGVFLRKINPDGSFDPKQIGMINRMITFTDDGFKTVKVGIGHFEDENLGEIWGIVAPNIVGTLVAGENLVIQNKVLKDDGTSIVKEFKVDSTGAWLNNTSLVFSQEKDPDTGVGGGRIFIDPKYGIGAGNEHLFTLGNNGTEIIPSFIDEKGNLVLDEEILGEIMDKDGNVALAPYLPVNTQFFFDIRTGDAYFGGTINGAKIMPGTVYGNVIADGTLDGKKLTGTLDPTLITNLSNANFADGKIIADEIDADKIVGEIVAAGSVLSERIIIQGENAELAIDPKYGIVAGNNDLFTVDDKGLISSTTFLNSDGSLKIDQSTGAPVNSSFYFDINTGKVFFTGDLNAGQIKAGTIDANIINVKNLNADNITAGYIDADRMKANVIDAINAYIGEAKITTANIDQLTANNAWVEGLLTSGEILTDTIHAATGKYTKDLMGVNIVGDCIVVNTLRADSLVLKGKDGLYRKLNVDALGEDVMEEYDNEYNSTGEMPAVYEGIDGKAIIVNSITADQIDVTDLFAQTITARGTISGGTFLQERSGFRDENGVVYGAGTYIGNEGVAFGNSLVYDAQQNKLIISADIIAKNLTLDKDATIEGLTGFATTEDLKNYATNNSLSVYIQKDGTLGTLPPKGATDAGGTQGFRVSTDGLLTASNAVIYGTVYASNGEFTGKISANKGEIGGFIIKDECLYNGDVDSLTSTATSGVYIGTDGIRLGEDFKVTKEGKLYLTKIFLEKDQSLVVDGFLQSNSNIYSKAAITSDGNMVCNGLLSVNGTSSTAASIYSKGFIQSDVHIYAKGYIQSDGNIICKGTLSVDDDIVVDGTSVSLVGHTHYRLVNSNGGEISYVYNSRLGKGIFYPAVNGGVNLGATDKRWNNIWAVTAEINGSDRNIKKDIEPLSNKYIDMFDSLEPVSYKLIDGTSGRTHVGFIAQDVESAMEKAGLTSLDFAGLCKDKKVISNEDGSSTFILDNDGNEIDVYSLRYSEFIAINTAKIKQLEQIIADLQAELNKLKVQVN